MSKSLEALKKIWHYAIQEHNNLFINDVFDNCYMPIKQDLELLGSLQQIWNNQEFCKGIPLSADGLNSLFNYNLDMFNKNLELDKKVLDLEKENQELKDTGILQLLTLGGCGIWVIIDLIMVITGKFTDAQGNVISNSKE